MSLEDMMKGKVCLVTGATSGIGKVTAIELARMGASVTIVGRDAARGAEALHEIKVRTRNEDVELLLCDLASQKSIKQFAEEFKARHDKLHVLVNNAAVSPAQRTLTEDGLESTFGVNHLGYYLLTNLLLDPLLAAKPARIVNVASSAHKVAPLDWDNLQGEKSWSFTRAYSASKLENVLFTYELARRLAGKGVAVNCLHPGVIPSSGLARDMPRIFTILLKVFSRLFFFGVSEEEGAKTTLYLASSPEVEGVTGKYFVKCKETTSSEASYDPASAARLWKVSAELTGVG